MGAGIEFIWRHVQYETSATHRRISLGLWKHESGAREREF